MPKRKEKKRAFPPSRMARGGRGVISLDSGVVMGFA